MGTGKATFREPDFSSHLIHGLIGDSARKSFGLRQPNGKTPHSPNLDGTIRIEYFVSESIHSSSRPAPPKNPGKQERALP